MKRAALHDRSIESHRAHRLLRSGSQPLDGRRYVRKHNFTTEQREVRNTPKLFDRTLFASGTNDAQLWLRSEDSSSCCR